jgi:hypothetical protein
MEGTMGDRVRSLCFEVLAFSFDPRGEGGVQVPAISVMTNQFTLPTPSNYQDQEFEIFLGFLCGAITAGCRYILAPPLIKSSMAMSSAKNSFTFSLKQVFSGIKKTK